MEPDSNVAGTDVGSLVVSARARFFGLLEGFGETERCPNWEEDGEWLGTPIRSGSNSLGGGG